jgi:hypothetical protein
MKRLQATKRLRAGGGGGRNPTTAELLSKTFVKICMHKSVYIARTTLNIFLFMYFVILRKIPDTGHGISKLVVRKHWSRQKTILILISVRNSNSVTSEIASDIISLG